MVKFSIIVPVYNVEKYLRECIESLVNQTFKNIEIILIDDGSPDNSPKICDEYAEKDNRIKVIHKENGGVVSARAAGVEISTGEYFIFVDADDWVSLDLCEKVNALIEVYSPDFICYDLYYVYDNHIINRPIDYKKGFYNRVDIENKIFPSLICTKQATNFVWGQGGKVVKRDIYIVNQIKDKKVIIAEDTACMVACVYNSFSVYNMGETLYYYRMNPNSATNSKKVIDFNGPKHIYEHINENINIDDFDLREQLYRFIVQQLFYVVISQFNSNESYWKIRKNIKMCLKEPIYKECIKNAKFSRIKNTLMVFALKYRWYLLMYLYNKRK